MLVNKSSKYTFTSEYICVWILWYSLQMGSGSVTFSLSFKLSIFPMSLSNFKKASYSSVNNFCTLTFWSSSKWFKLTFGSHLGLSLQILIMFASGSLLCLVYSSTATEIRPKYPIMVFLCNFVFVGWMVNKNFDGFTSFWVNSC